MGFFQRGAGVALLGLTACGSPTESTITSKIATSDSIKGESLALQEDRATAGRGIFEGINGAVAFKCSLHDYQIYTGYLRPGGKNWRLTHNSFADDQPALSADGSKIAFHRTKPQFSGICVINTDGTGERCIDSSSKDMEPSWSPDGTRIAFVSNRNKGNGIYIMDADGSHVTPLETDSIKENRQPKWSPDGTKILFSSNRQGGWEIYTFDLNQRQLTKITNSKGIATEAVWNADGSKIAYASNRSRGWQIYMVNADGTGDVRLTNLPKGAREPSWAANGRIFFITEDNMSSIEAVPDSQVRRDYWGPIMFSDQTCRPNSIKVTQPDVLTQPRRIPANTYFLARDFNISWSSPHTINEIPYVDIPLDLSGVDPDLTKVRLSFAVEGAGDDIDRSGSFGVMQGSQFLELTRFVTDYGGRVAWSADLSAFRPLFSGPKTFRIQMGVQGGGYNVSAALTFEAPTNPERIKKVVPLMSYGWVGYGEGNVTKRTFNLGSLRYTFPTTGSARLVNIITGHGDASGDECLGAEFCPRHHSFTLSDAAPYTQLIWRDNCRATVREESSPNNTSGSRAGWCPGDQVYPWIQNLDRLPNARDFITYDVVEPAGPGDYVDYTAYYVSSYLVFYE